MADWSLPLHAILVAGKSGSGKSTFGLRYLLNVQDVACRFIFDDLGQCLARLKIPHASTANEVEAALATRWVNFNPHRMFPGRLDDAFRWFCHFAFAASQRGRGRKIVYIDEVWRFQDRDDLPQELAILAQMGRAEGIELFTLSQHPHKINSSIYGNLSELVCFRVEDNKDVLSLSKMGANVDEIKGLPLGSFIAYNKNTGGVLRHKLFDPA